MLHKYKKIILEFTDYTKKTTDELTKSFVQARGDINYRLNRNPNGSISADTIADTILSTVTNKDIRDGVKSGYELRQRFGINNKSKEMKNLIQGQLERNKREQDVELSKIPSAKQSPNPEAINIPKEPLSKIKSLPEKDNNYIIHRQSIKTHQNEDNKIDNNNKMLAGGGVIAGLGVAGYAAYKMAKKKKWRDKGCSTLSGSEKDKCENYLKSITKKDKNV